MFPKEEDTVKTIISKFRILAKQLEEKAGDDDSDICLAFTAASSSVSRVCNEVIDDLGK